MSAKTRSWDTAENLARAERGRLDPEKIEKRKIAGQEEARKGSAITVEDALSEWVASTKRRSQSPLPKGTGTTPAKYPVGRLETA
jgi:hypothetical protein